MTCQRPMSEQEKAVVTTLLQGRPEASRLMHSLEGIVVEDMEDGGMGSLLLIPKAAENTQRSMGAEIASGTFRDSDGVLVVVAVNVDKNDMLYELDVWKVTFEPLLSLPAPSQITVIR